MSPLALMHAVKAASHYKGVKSLVIILKAAQKDKADQEAEFIDQNIGSNFKLGRSELLHKLRMGMDNKFGSQV
jgi:hypothetical protein